MPQPGFRPVYNPVTVNAALHGITTVLITAIHAQINDTTSVMLYILASVYSLLVAVGLLMLGIGLFNTFISLRADLEGFSHTTVGLLMSAYYGGLVLGTQRCGALINRVGHIRAFSAFCAANAAGALLFPFVTEAAAWMLLRALSGFNLAGLYMVIESWLNTRATAATRGALLSLYMIVSYIGMGGGNLLLNAGDPAGFELFALVAMLFALALIPVAVTRATHPAPVSASRFGFRRLYAISPLAVLSCISAGLSVGALFGLGPLFAQDIGLSLRETSVFMGLLVVSGLLLQWPVGRWSDRRDRRGVIIAVAVAASLSSFAMLPALASGTTAVFVMTVVYGALSAMLYPLGVAYANDYIDPSDMVQASAGLVLSYGLGAAIGPLLAALAMNLTGPGGLFGFCAVVSALLVVFALYRTRCRAWAPISEKEAFVPLPEASTTPIATELDPRTKGTQLALDLGEPSKS